MLATPVTNDIYQVRLPLPFRLDHVNCYLLRGDEGWTIVDTGLNWPEARTTWQAALAELQIGPDDVGQIVLTHMHPDHFGLAGWFQDWCGRTIYLSPREAEQVEQVWVNEAWRPDRVIGWWDRCGVPRAVSRDAAAQSVYLRAHTLPHPEKMQIVEYGTTICMGGRTFRTIHTPGHSDGHIIFYDVDDGLLLSGDQVLMRITPNIGLWPTTEADPLGRYLHSLFALGELHVRLALPGHRNVITDWRGRLAELRDHHDVRLQHVVDAVQGGARRGGQSTAFDVCCAVFQIDGFSPHEIRFAVAETLAHLEHLVTRGQLTRDGDAVWWYRVG